MAKNHANRKLGLMLYWDALDRDTAHLTLEQMGGYIRVLMHLDMAETRGKSVKNLAQWANIMRTTPKEAAEVIRILREEDICKISTGIGGAFNLRGTERNKNIKIVQRRMYREFLAQKASTDRSRKARGTRRNGNATQPIHTEHTKHTKHTSSCVAPCCTDADDVVRKDLEAKLGELNYHYKKKDLGDMAWVRFMQHLIQENPQARGGLIRTLAENTGRFNRFKNDLLFQEMCKAIPLGSTLWSDKKLTEGIWAKNSFDGYEVLIAGEPSVIIETLADLNEWSKIDSVKEANA